MNDQRLALFLMLGQSATKETKRMPGLVPTQALKLSQSHDLAVMMPDEVRDAIEASEAYKLFFIFENYLRDFAIKVLTVDGTEDWWPKVPKDVQDELEKLEEAEDTKSWMALGSRDKSSLLTYPQILRIIEHNWKTLFEDLIRDRFLIQEARMIGHLRNTICHMTKIPEEEIERVRLVIRDWFRRVAP